MAAGLPAFCVMAFLQQWDQTTAGGEQLSAGSCRCLIGDLGIEAGSIGRQSPRSVH